MFASDGYLAAAPDRLFWKVGVRVEAGDDALSFGVGEGEDASLLAGGRRLAALGLARSGLPSSPGLPARISIPPGQDKRMVLVFDVPGVVDRGKLTVAQVGSVPVRLPDEDSPPDHKALRGRYVEQFPRNLRPNLSGPVASAIQQSGPLTLRVGDGADGGKVEMPEAEVSGRVEPAGAGLFEAELKRGDDERRCTLRLADGGGRVILYLADERWHQVVFARESGP